MSFMQQPIPIYVPLGLMLLLKGLFGLECPATCIKCPLMGNYQ